LIETSTSHVEEWQATLTQIEVFEEWHNFLNWWNFFKQMFGEYYQILNIDNPILFQAGASL